MLTVDFLKLELAKQMAAASCLEYDRKRTIIKRALMTGMQRRTFHNRLRSVAQSFTSAEEVVKSHFRNPAFAACSEPVASQPLTCLALIFC